MAEMPRFKYMMLLLKARSFLGSAEPPFTQWERCCSLTKSVVCACALLCVTIEKHMRKASGHWDSSAEDTLHLLLK
jgi:hypothetical protein